jgi:hypothetical protein
MLVGKQLIEKIKELTKDRPSISRRDLAQACGYGRGLKSDIEAFENATLAATGILPTEPVEQTPASRSVFPVSPKGLVCVRRGWLQKIGANVGDSINIHWNSEEEKIEITKVVVAGTAVPVVEPVVSTAVEAPSVTPPADPEVPASSEVVDVVKETLSTPDFIVDVVKETLSTPDFIPATFSVAELTTPELEELIESDEDSSDNLQAVTAEA